MASSLFTRRTGRNDAVVLRAAPQGAPDRQPLDSVVICPVPEDQQPVRELDWLKEDFLFAWATLPVPQFAARLAGVWGIFLVTMGLPVSAVTFDMNTQTLECFVSAGIGSLLIVMVTLARLYLGWSHVGNRLLSATVEYEETGWYDGQIWVKDPAVLMRDRLLGLYTVKPTLARLKGAMASMAGLLATSAVLLALLPAPDANSMAVAGRGASGQQQLAAALGANPAGVQRQSSRSTDDYWKAVECFEPWALDGSDGGDPAERSPGPRAHMDGCK